MRDENSVAALMWKVTDNANNLSVIDGELVNGGIGFSHGVSIGYEVIQSRIILHSQTA